MKKILGVCIGSCIHVAGVLNFLASAKTEGYETRFSGSAVDIDKLAEEIEEYRPDIVAISYRLSPESIMPVFDDLAKKIRQEPVLEKVDFILGTTKPVAEIAGKTKIFKKIFTGTKKSRLMGLAWAISSTMLSRLRCWAWVN